MSLNRYEQTLFSYMESHTDELRHWRSKVESATRGPVDLGVATRQLERELRAYLAERSEQVSELRELTGDARGLLLLNLAEYLVRIWGPLPKPKKPTRPAS